MKLTEESTCFTSEDQPILRRSFIVSKITNSKESIFKPDNARKVFLIAFNVAMFTVDFFIDYSRPHVSNFSLSPFFPLSFFILINFFSIKIGTEKGVIFQVNDMVTLW
jgi:hypothetical protein